MPAHAVTTGDPCEPIGPGLEPDLTFNAIDARDLLAVWSASRGGFSSAASVSIAAAGDPDVRGRGYRQAHGSRAQIAHDSRRDRSLLAFVVSGTGRSLRTRA